jgi:hypothetical protein
VEFVIADGYEDDMERTVHLRATNATEAQLREGFLAPTPIHYGTHFFLSAPDAVVLVAVCTSGPEAAPNEPGEFLLYVDGELAAERASRFTVLEAFSAALRK